MKKFITFFCKGIFIETNAQYFQRYDNFDFATPKYRDEIFNGGIKVAVRLPKLIMEKYWRLYCCWSSNNQQTLPQTLLHQVLAMYLLPASIFQSKVFFKTFYQSSSSSYPINMVPNLTH